MSQSWKTFQGVVLKNSSPKLFSSVHHRTLFLNVQTRCLHTGHKCTDAHIWWATALVFFARPAPNRKTVWAQQTKKAALWTGLSLGAAVRLLWPNGLFLCQLSGSIVGLRLLLCKTCPQLAFVNIDPSVCYPTASTLTVMHGCFQLMCERRNYMTLQGSIH